MRNFFFLLTRLRESGKRRIFTLCFVGQLVQASLLLDFLTIFDFKKVYVFSPG